MRTESLPDELYALSFAVFGSLHLVCWIFFRLHLTSSLFLSCGPESTLLVLPATLLFLFPLFSFPLVIIY